MRKWVILSILIVALAACTAQPSPAPTIRLESPEDGVQVVLGERVLVQAVAQGEQGVVKTELWADGRLYEVEGSEEPKGQPQLDAIHIWEASSIGTHTLSLRAHSSDGQVSSPIMVTIYVVEPKPTPTSEPTSVPTVVIDSSCVPSARFVEDVTVPDDSLFNSGVRFTKTWRLRNDGECAWEPGTKWVFINGDLLDAQSPADAQLALPGRIVDLSVDMVAPGAPGTYKSYWRLQRPNGDFFGDQAYVRIIVP